MSLLFIMGDWRHFLRRLVRKLNNAWSVFQGIYRYNFESHLKPLAPRAVLISLTYWCNSRCIMCNIWKIRPKNELSYQEWEVALQDPLFKKIERCGLTGGEISLHPELVKLVQLIIRSMPKLKKLTMVSHGFMTDLIVERVKEIARLCNEHNVELSVSISLDGVGDMHEKIRRIPEAFRKATMTLFELKKLALEYGFHVGSGSLVLKQNLDEVENIRNWYKKNKINGIFQIVGFHNTYLQNTDTRANVDFDKSTEGKLEKFMTSMSKPQHVRDLRSYYWRDLLAMYRDKQPRTTPCPFQYDQFAFDSFGDVYNCFSAPKIGNFRDGKKISEILFDPKNLAFKNRMRQSLCLRCNSGCDVDRAIIRDAKKYIWYRLTGKLWHGSGGKIPQQA